RDQQSFHTAAAGHRAHCEGAVMVPALRPAQRTTRVRLRCDQGSRKIRLSRVCGDGGRSRRRRSQSDSTCRGSITSRNGHAVLPESQLRSRRGPSHHGEHGKFHLGSSRMADGGYPLARVAEGHYQSGRRRPRRPKRRRWDYRFESWRPLSGHTPGFYQRTRAGDQESAWPRAGPGRWGNPGGTDVLKALAFGAKAVLIGRPYLYGLAVNGAEGVASVVNILRNEFLMAMASTGRPNVAAIDRSVLWNEQ